MPEKAKIFETISPFPGLFERCANGQEIVVADVYLPIARFVMARSDFDAPLTEFYER
jgi:hypothetical protein